MGSQEVVLLHPPAIYDFRRKAIFAGVMAATPEQAQFTRVPIGMLSLAAYLDRHGYKVTIDNLGDRMVSSPAFGVENHLKGLSAAVYAIGLHFQQHAPGALAIARLLKKLHPGATVVLGGLTATRFEREILEKYPFVDGVLRGEAEKPFLELLRSLEKNGRLKASPNLTFRSPQGEILSSPLMAVDPDLDEYDFTRLDLLQPATSVFTPGFLPRWSLEVCRGCLYNCAICGGSAYTYRTYLGRERPAFRSPERIIRDIASLNSLGIRIIGLYQDPRLGGEAYWRDLLRRLRAEKLNIDRLSIDLLAPAAEEFIAEVARIGRPVTLHICPDSGCESVRRLLGRHYSNEELLNTIRLCHKYLIPVTTFFSTGLAGEDRENIGRTWEMMEQLCSLEQLMFTRGASLGLGSGVHLGGPITGPVLLDPGSPAFDNPEKYGYRLLYKDLEEYIRALSDPSWHQWLNYETEKLDRQALTSLILESAAVAIDQREAYELSSPAQSRAERQKLRADIQAVNEVNRISTWPEEQREAALQALKARLAGPSLPPVKRPV